MCLWVSFDPWLLCEWVVFTMSSEAPPRSCRPTPVALSMDSIHLVFGLPLFLLPSIFPSIIVFSINLAVSCHAQSRTASFLSLVTSSDVQAYFALRLTCSSFWWSRQGICRALFQHHIQMHHFLPIRLLHCPAFMFVHIRWEYEGVDDLSLGL